MSDPRDVPGALPFPPEAKLLSDAVDREIDSDRRFFTRRPRRTYRLRRAFPAELKQQSIVCGMPEHAPDGLAIFVIVRKVATDMRIRVFVLMWRDIDTDLTDDEARRIFDAVASSKVREVERRMLEANAARTAGAS